MGGVEGVVLVAVLAIVAFTCLTLVMASGFLSMGEKLHKKQKRRERVISITLPHHVNHELQHDKQAVMQVSESAGISITKAQKLLADGKVAVWYQDDFLQLPPGGER